MNVIALKMLLGDRAKYIGIIMGLTFASLLITQQLGIFVGIMARTYGFITDAGLADIWVMDAKVQFNDHRAIVAGLCQVSRTFQSQPVVYTTYSRATTFAPRERKRLSFVLVKARPDEDVEVLSQRIQRITGLAAYPHDTFAQLTVQYYMKYTGI